MPDEEGVRECRRPCHGLDVLECVGRRSIVEKRAKLGDAKHEGGGGLSSRHVSDGDRDSGCAMILATRADEQEARGLAALNGDIGEGVDERIVGRQDQEPQGVQVQRGGSRDQRQKAQ